MPKHVRLRKAVLAAIAAGALRPGDQLPPELQVTEAIDASLGTVQRALNRLALDGAIVRRHGRGTFVSEPLPLDELWQFRFSAPGETSFLPVSAAILERRCVPSTDTLARALGPEPAGYVEISRLLNVAGRFICHSCFYVGMTRFHGLLTLPARAFDPGNLKVVLRHHFAAPTISITQRVRAAAFDAEVADAIGLVPGTIGLLLESVGQSYGDAPLSFQRVWIPPNDCFLDMSTVQWERRAETLT